MDSAAPELHLTAPSMLAVYIMAHIRITIEPDIPHLVSFLEPAVATNGPGN